MAFNTNTRLIAAARTGGICANPRCSCYLLGPGDDGPDHVDVFEAAHIISEAPNGPRYQDEPGFKYDHISNCIPLCRSCHRLVDHSQNWRMYPAAVLREWKEQAEEMARIRRNKPVNVPFFDPNKERKIKEDFSAHLSEIVQPLRDAQQFVSDGILPLSARTKICNGAFGFSAGKWTYNNPHRSHDARIAHHQDILVEIMARLYTLLSKREWERHDWINDINLCSFRETSNLSELDIEYNNKLQHELQILNRYACEFMEMPY